MNHYKGNFHAEQDISWESEQCPVRKIWTKTKKVSEKTWTIYERVEDNFKTYQTPRFYCKNEKEALEILKTLPE